jgi:LppX_LprAFG lipoprotein
VVAVAAIAIATVGGSSKTTSQSTPAQVLAAATRNAATLRSLSATMTEQIGGATGETISGSVAEQRNPLQMSMTMTESTGGQAVPPTAIVTGSSMYLKFGAMAGLPATIEGKWLEFSLNALGIGSFGSLMHSMESENPVSQTQALAAAQQLRAAGTQVLDGVETTKYTGYYTAAGALKALPASARAALAPTLNKLTGDAHFTIWIDGKDEIRKMITTETVASEPVTVTLTYGSFNQPVTIVIPPADQVLRFPASVFNSA